MQIATDFEKQDCVTNIIITLLIGCLFFNAQRKIVLTYSERQQLELCKAKYSEMREASYKGDNNI